MSPKTETLDKTYEVRVQVEYVYYVEAESVEDAEGYGWEYQDYPYNASVDSIIASELPTFEDIEPTEDEEMRD